nr:dTDP-fucosamine acetyltransferase [Paraburkholderia busanensis]
MLTSLRAEIPDTSAIQLRPLSAALVDRRALFALYKLSLYEHIDQTFGWDENFQQQRFSTSYRDDDFIAITQGPLMLGYVALKDETDEIHLSLLLVQPEHRNRQTGRQVMEALLSWAARSQRSVALSCFLCNRAAMRFYERLGFGIVTKDEHFVTYRFPVS